MDITSGGHRLPLRVGSLDPQRLLISDLVVANVIRGLSWVLRDAASVSPSPVIPTPLVSKDLQYFPDLGNPSRLPKHAPLYLYFEVYQPTSDTQASRSLLSAEDHQPQDGLAGDEYRTGERSRLDSAG